VRAGDTLTTKWTVCDVLAKPKHSGGVVVLDGTATNQEGVVVAQAHARILVGDR
jgi:acyl dehydratase